MLNNNSNNYIMTKKKILIIAGPTAVGKTFYSIELAKRFNGEIVSCDSMQLYKYMDIGSAKPTEEEQAQVPHHLIDFFDPLEDFSVAKYQKLALDAINDIIERGKLPIISGGTGLYLNSILYDMDFADAPKDSSYRTFLEEIVSNRGSEALYEMLAEKDPEAAESIHPNNTKRLIRALERLREGETVIHKLTDMEGRKDAERKNLEPVSICLTRDREELYERINQRVDSLIERGLIEEVTKLMSMGLTSVDISMKGIGYKEVIQYLEDIVSKEEAIDIIKRNSRHYAKRQLTWFRRYDKMKWINLSEYLNEESALEDISKWLTQNL